jgi:hypothetical protein
MNVCLTGLTIQINNNNSMNSDHEDDDEDANHLVYE